METPTRETALRRGNVVRTKEGLVGRVRDSNTSPEPPFFEVSVSFPVPVTAWGGGKQQTGRLIRFSPAELTRMDRPGACAELSAAFVRFSDNPGEWEFGELVRAMLAYQQVRAGKCKLGGGDETVAEEARDPTRVEAGKDYPSAEQTKSEVARQIDADRSAPTPSGQVDGRTGQAETGSKKQG